MGICELVLRMRTYLGVSPALLLRTHTDPLSTESCQQGQVPGGHLLPPHRPPEELCETHAEQPLSPGLFYGSFSAPGAGVRAAAPPAPLGGGSSRPCAGWNGPFPVPLLTAAGSDRACCCWRCRCRAARPSVRPGDGGGRAGASGAWPGAEGGRGGGRRHGGVRAGGHPGGKGRARAAEQRGARGRQGRGSGRQPRGSAGPPRRGGAEPGCPPALQGRRAVGSWRWMRPRSPGLGRRAGSRASSPADGRLARVEAVLGCAGQDRGRRGVAV